MILRYSGCTVKGCPHKRWTTEIRGSERHCVQKAHRSLFYKPLILVLYGKTRLERKETNESQANPFKCVKEK
uniref:Uncharacterized protein n=1 Tax=Arion vulgaris TaxID=1028688 RepID=A0A0B7B0T9_9EUPU